MSNTTLKLETLTCPSCMQKITDAVNALEGVETIKILFDSSKARVIYNEEIVSEAEIMAQINRTGYEVEPIK